MRRPVSLLLATLCALLQPATASAFDNFEPVPGGIAGVTVATPEEPAPRVLFGSHEVPVLRHSHGWTALVGVSRDLAPGYYVVNAIDAESHHQSHTFRVGPINRPVYSINVSDRSTLGEVAARHRRALSEVPAPDEIEGSDPPDLDFVLPVDLPIRFQFGMLNFTDTGYTLDFPGLGFEPGENAAVVNPAFGQVVAIDGSEGRWRLVIHHGAGLTSVFRNLESVSVTLEDWVPKGARLGTLTGRDGVRLLPDWTVLLGGTQVDPLLLVSQKIELQPVPDGGVAPVGKIE